MGNNDQSNIHASAIAFLLEGNEIEVASILFSCELISTGCYFLIATSEGWVVLGVVLDLFSRQVVGWATGSSENEEPVTLADAAWRWCVAIQRVPVLSSCIIPIAIVRGWVSSMPGARRD